MLLSSFAANSPEAGKQHTLAKISVTSLTFNLNNKPVIFKPAYKPAYKLAFKWAFQARPLHHHFKSRWQSNPAFSSQRFDSNFESAFATSLLSQFLQARLLNQVGDQSGLQTGLLVMPSSQSCLSPFESLCYRQQLCPLNFSYACQEAVRPLSFLNLWKILDSYTWGHISNNRSHISKISDWITWNQSLGNSCALSIPHTLAKKPSAPYLSWTFGQFWIHTIVVTFQTMGITFRKYRIE